MAETDEHPLLFQDRTLTVTKKVKLRLDYVEDEVETYLKGQLSLKEVIHKLEKNCGQKLSDQDFVRVEDIYVDNIISLWIDEGVQRVKDEFDSKNPLKILETVKTVNSFSTCRELFGNSRSYNVLLCELSETSSVLKSREKKSIFDLKERIYASILEKTKNIQDEINFFESFLVVLKSFLSVPEFCNRFNVFQFICHRTYFKPFLQNLLENKYYCPKLCKLQQYAGKILIKDDFIFYEDLKELVLNYLGPVEIKECNVEGRQLLEISGKHIVISKELDNITKLPSFSLVEEVRFVNAGVVHVDASLEKSIWHGKNIVLYAETLIVNAQKHIVWDVSGLDANIVSTVAAGTSDEGYGLKGEDGNPGESGGNVCLLVQSIENGVNFEIVSNGGKGSKGQNGGSGANGRDGEFIDEHKFKENFPPVSNLWSKKKNYQKTKESVLENLASVDRFHYGLSEFNVSEEDFRQIIENGNLRDIYFETTTKEGCQIKFSFKNDGLRCCQSFLLYKGALGELGKAGGAGGLGGDGGFHGDINVQCLKNSDHLICTRATNGDDGEVGIPGKTGISGKNGLDRGYMDCTLAIIHSLFSSVTWPKYFIPRSDENISLTVKFYDQKTSKRVLCPLDNRYAEITPIKRTEEVNLQFHLQQGIEEQANFKFNTNVKRKKNISSESIVEQYKGKDSVLSLTNFVDILINYKKALDELMSEETTQSEKVTEVVKTTRKISFPPNDWFVEKTKPGKQERKKKKLHRGNANGSTQASIYNNTIPKSFAKTHPVRQTLHAVSVEKVDSFSRAVIMPDSKTVNVSFEQHCLDKLNFINATSLENIFDNFSDVKLRITDARFLVEPQGIVDISKQGTSSHIERFLCEDSTSRQDLVRICKWYDFDGQPLQEALKSFIFQFSSEDICDVMYKALNDFQLSKEMKLKEKLAPLKTLICTKSQNKHLHKCLLDSILKQCVKSQLKFVDGIVGDKFLNYLYTSFLSELKKEFEWDSSCKNQLGNILNLFVKSVEEDGPFTNHFREFLAYHFDTNIHVYNPSRNDSGMTLDSNHNPNAKSKIHFLLKSKKFVKLNLNEDLVGLFGKCNLHRKFFSKIMFQFCSFTEKSQVDDYVSKTSFTTISSSTLTSSDVVAIKIKHIINQENYINTISNLYLSKKALVRCRLEKLKIEFIGYETILHYMAMHFEVEGNRTTVNELCFIINLILMFSVEELEVMSQVSWIIAAQPQQCWLVELALLKCELYLKRPLGHDIKFKWRHFMKEPTEKKRLMVFLKKLDCEANRFSVEGLGELLNLMSNVPKAQIGLEHINIGEWKYYLTDRFWAHRMGLISDWTEEQLKILSFYLVNLENSIGNEFCLSLINTVSEATEIKSNEDKNLFLKILKRLHNIEVCSIVGLWEKLSLNPMKDWLQILDVQSSTSESHRTLPQLIELIKHSQIVSENIHRRIPEVKRTLELSNEISTSLKGKDVDEKKLKLLFSKVLNSTKNEDTVLDSLHNFLKDVIPDENTFKTIINKVITTLKPIAHFRGSITFSKLPSTSEIRGQSISPHSDIFYIGSNMLPFIELAIKLKHKISLRDTQKLTVLTLLKNAKGTLAQVNTGEGKSLIVVTVSIIRALCNEKVNVITSSKVLAERDAQKYKDIYELCGVSVGHNCSEDISDRKKVYSNCQVIYGCLANFQRDYLLDRAYDKNILGDSSFETVIVDEVDSLLLDKGNNVLYLSHDIPGLDKLEPVFIYIWKLINMPVSQDLNEHILTIKQNVMYDLFGVVSKEDLKRLDISVSEGKIVNTWSYLLDREVIHSSGKVLKRSVSDCNFDDLPGNCISKAHLEFIIHKIISRERKLNIPNYLKQFVEDHLDSWIKSGINAMVMEVGRNYIVDVDRSGTIPDKDSIITIIDIDTGTDLYNSHWDEALHQFLQLKHGCKLSLMTLKAVFISNVAFLKLFKVLYGLTGTLGSKCDRELLQEIYGVDFVMIPTSKTKNFSEEPSILCSSTEEWKQKILEEVYNVLSQKRSALIICESISDVEILRDKFDSKFSTEQVFIYKRDHEVFLIDDLQPERIIISTNLAGRGTDIKLSKELIANGGLFVCLSFLPSSYRVEEQAYGRAARNGEPGTAQLIFRCIKQSANNTTAKVIDYRKQRDNNELKRISDIKSHYENQIKPQEIWFGQFCDLYKCLKKIKQVEKIKQGEKVKSILQEAYLNQWAFWLDQNEKRLISNRSTEGICSSLGRFLADWRKLDKENVQVYDWMHLIKDPTELVKLGLVYLEEKQMDDSLLMFNKVLEQEPNFSEIALYYKICAECQQKNEILNYFKTAAKQIKDRADSLLTSSFLIELLQKHDVLNVIKVNSFSDQQRNIGTIYNVILQSIYSIIGTEVTAHSFFLPLFIDYHVSEDIYNSLIELELISKPLVESNISEDDLLLVKDYGLSPSQMSEFIQPLKGKDFIECEFLESLKKKFAVPCRELFWEELIKNQILTEEEEYIFIHMQELKTVHPSLYGKIKSQSAQECLKPTNKLWLYQPEELFQVEGDETQLFMTRQQFLGLIGRNSNQILLLKNKNIVFYNKLAVFSGRKNVSFERFDSMCIEDFQLVNICEETALKIIEDLTSQQIIKEKSNERPGCYYLLIETENIETICLKDLKAYTCEIRSLMSICFAFRIAFEKLCLLMDDTYESICIPLKIKLYERIVLDFKQMEIISKSFIIGDLSKLDGFYPKYMPKDRYKKILSQVLGDMNCDSLIDKLIKNKWLVGDLFHNKTYSINAKIKNFYNQGDKKENGKENPIPLNCEMEETTLVTLINQFNLVENLNHIKIVLNSCKGNYDTVKDPIFVLTPLLDAFPQKELVSEIDRFSLNGFDQLIVLKEKKWSVTTMSKIMTVVAFGIVQIGTGVASQFLFPANTAGVALVSEGISDLIFTVSCMITGYFSLKDYFINKVLSLVISAASIGSMLRGKSTFGSKVTAMLSGKSTVKSVAKASPSKMVRSIVKASSIKIVTAISQGLIYGTLDHVIKPKLQDLSEALTTAFYSNISDTLKTHPIISSIEELCKRFGPESSRRTLLQLFRTHTTDFEGKFCSSLKNSLDSIESLIMKDFKTLFKNKSMNKLQFYTAIASAFFNVCKLVNGGLVLFQRVESQIINCLDVIEKHLKDLMKQDEQKNGERFLTATKCTLSKKDMDHITSEVSKDWETHWHNLLSDSFTRIVLSPLLQSISNYIVNFSSKYMFNNTKEFETTDDTLQRNASIYKGIQTKKKRKSNIANSEYEGYLLDLLKKKRNVAVYVEIIRKNLPVDTHFVEMCCFVLPKALEYAGVPIPNLDIIVERNGINQRFSTVNKQNGKPTIIITISPESDLITNLKKNQTLVHNGVNIILSKLAQQYPELEGLPLEVLRSLVASNVETVFGTQPSFPTVQYNPLLASNRYKIKPPTQYRFPNHQIKFGKSLSCNMNVDELLTEEKLSSMKNIEDHICKGFRLALEKINNHICRVQGHCRSLKLVIEDFDPSNYEIVPQTNREMLCNFYCFPTHYELVLPFVVDCNKVCLGGFKVTMSLHNYDCGNNSKTSCDPFISYEVCPKEHSKYLDKGTKGYILLHKDCSEPRFTVKNCHAAGELILPGCQLQRQFRALILGVSMLKPSEFKVTCNPDFVALSFPGIIQLKSKIRSLAKIYKGVGYVYLIPGPSSIKSSMPKEDIQFEVADAVDMISFEFGNVKVVVCSLMKSKEVSLDEAIQTNRCLNSYVSAKKSDFFCFLRIHELLTPDVFKKYHRYLDKHCFTLLLNSLPL